MRAVRAACGACEDSRMHLLRFLAWLLPASRLKNGLLSITPGGSVHRSARLAPNLVWRVQRATIGPRVAVGLGNAFRDLLHLDLAADSAIGQFNWVTGSARWVRCGAGESEPGLLRLENHAAVTSRHYLDASGGLMLGRFSTLGGVRSTVLSHSVDVQESVLRLAPVRVGRHGLVLTNAVLLPGSVVGDDVVVGAHSLVAGELGQAQMLYGGSPARPVSSMAGAKWFARTRTSVTAPEEQKRLIREMPS